VRRKTHERILADRERRALEERRQLFETIDRLNDRLMFLVGARYAPAAGEPEPPDSDEDFETLPASAIDQYPYE
jgi:hypothetical protein